MALLSVLVIFCFLLICMIHICFPLLYSVKPLSMSETISKGEEEIQDTVTSYQSVFENHVFHDAKIILDDNVELESIGKVSQEFGARLKDSKQLVPEEILSKLLLPVLDENQAVKMYELDHNFVSQH